jgi:DNA-binding MarR family transcriptional regulator
MTPAPPSDRDVFDEQVEAALVAARVFVGIVLTSTEEVESTVTLRQLRALVILNRFGGLNLAALAEHLRIHPSNATRLCDRLVDAQLVRRQQAAHDRRHIQLTITPAGRELVDGVLARRRTALSQTLAAMPAAQRAKLAEALQAFAVAAGEVHDAEGWASEDHITGAVGQTGSVALTS